MKYTLKNEIESKKAIERFKYLLTKQKDIELKEVRKSKTVSQNSYLHVCIDLFGIAAGYTSKESKKVLKNACNFMSYTKKNIVFLKSCADLNTKESTDFIEFIRNYSVTSLGNYIPTADEYLQHKFHIDKEISNNKAFL